MNLALSFVLVLSAGALGTWAFLSGPNANEVGAASPPAVARATASQARLEERALARWNAVCRADWIAAYEFQTSEQKALPLSRYLQGKDHHQYANPSIDRVLDVTATEGFLIPRVLWTPVLPQLKQVKLEPGQSLTEEIEMVESWRWEVDDWYFVRAQRVDEFMKAYPHLSRR